MLIVSKLGYVAAIVMVCLLFAGCASTTYLQNNYTPRVYTTINSFGNYDVKNKTFYIESGDENVSSSDAEFKEYARYIVMSLELQGAVETTNKTAANVCVLVAYGISDESYVENVSVPVWGQTGVAATITTSNTKSSASSTAYGSATTIGKSTYGSAYGTASGNSTTTTTSYNIPQYGVTGYRNVQRKVTIFRRYLNVYAYDNRNRQEPTMLYKTNLVSDGENSNLREIIPYMVFNAWITGYLGRSTNEAKTYYTYVNDFYYTWWVKGILLQDNITMISSVSSAKYHNNNGRLTMRLQLVWRGNDETIVTFLKDGCADSYGFGSETYIEYGSQQQKLVSIDGYEIGTKIRNECGTRYFLMHFPSLPKSIKSFDITGYDKKGNIQWYWNGVQIR